MRRIIAGGGLLALVYIAGEIATLLRTVVFANWLSPAEMGALVLMMTSLRLVEMITDVSIERLVLQAPDGASRRFQALAHGASLLRGLIGAAALLLLALPLAHAFALDPRGFALLALVPLVRGFVHLDARIHNRHSRASGVALIEGSGALAGLLMAAPAVLITKGPEAAAWAGLAQAFAMVAVSHAIARRPYRLALSGSSLRRFWRFGWPLALNGLLLYAVFQGERLAVGSFLGLETLGRFGIASQLALIPALLAGRVALSVLLPVAARSPERGRGLFGLGILYGAAATGVMFTGAFAVAMPHVIALLFGPAYGLELAVIAWLGAAAGLRIARVGPVTLLLALGDSRGVLAGSFLRALALGAGIGMVLLGHGLVGFAAMAGLGEAASLIATAFRLRLRAAMPRALETGLILLALAMPVLALCLPQASLNGALALTAGLTALGLAFMKRPRWRLPSAIPAR